MFFLCLYLSNFTIVESQIPKREPLTLFIKANLFWNKSFSILSTKILKKYLPKSMEIRQNWTRPENFDISFGVSFGH